MTVEATEVLRRLAAGNYHHEDGLRAMQIGAVSSTLFMDLLNDMRQIVDNYPASVVREGEHVTGWTLPQGEVKQWSLLNTHGRTDDTSDDFRYDNLNAKDPLGLPGLMTLAGSLPSIVNLRLNLIGPGSSLSPHEEPLERDLGDGRVALRARFHLPLRTTRKALMLADGDLFHFEAGRVYLFNNGCVHSASNEAKTDRLHLVWDQLMTEEAVDAMFGGTPPAWLEQDLAPAKIAGRLEVETWQRQWAISEEDFYARELVFHP